MTEPSTTDPDAGRLDIVERLRDPGSEYPESPLFERWVAVRKATLDEAADTLAALRERAERAEELYDQALSIIRADELEDLAEQNTRLRAALGEREHMIRFLAKVVTGGHRARYEALALEPEACKDHLTLHFPIVQGTRVQFALQRLGEQPYDHAKVGAALNALDPRRALSASPAPEVRDGK